MRLVVAVKLVFAGGACEIGASAILLRICDKNILLDCGIRQNNSVDELPDFRSIQEAGGVDAIVVSHAHLDHTGTLPIISREYPMARIYTNYMTKDLMRVLLYDSLKIMNSREGEIPKFSEPDVVNLLDRVYALNPEVEFEIFDGIKLTFYMAGHIGGASCVYIKSKEGTLFYSGDFSIFPQNTVDGARIPKLRPDVAIFESTYGDKLHSNRDVEEKKLLDLVSECTKMGGKVLIPAFALGRAQEIILILKRAMRRGTLEKTKVYVDGMVKNINEAYKAHPTYLRNSLAKKILRGTEPFYDDNIIKIENQQDRDKIVSEKGPYTIVSSSGMLIGGPSQFYAEKLSMDEENRIVLAGYQDEESPGGKLLALLDAAPGDRVLDINNKRIPINYKIDRVGLSAHGDKSEIKSLADSLSPANIFLVHGEEEVIRKLARDISQETRSSIFVPHIGEEYEIEIRKPRKQLKYSHQFTMGIDEPLSEENISRLWNFVLKYYKEKLLKAEDILYIWSGSRKYAEEDIDRVKNLLFNTPYFEPDRRRLFLYKAREQTDVEEELKPKELKQNEVNDIVKQYFEAYDYQKAGLLINEKKVILYFDFPKAVDSSIYGHMDEFTKETSWEVSIHGQSNLNAAEGVIRQLLEGADIKKISYFPGELKFAVQLNKGYEIGKEPDAFKKMTGLSLEILNPGVKSNTENLEFVKSEGRKQMEQNMALSYIDSYFNSMEHKPYKKSIKAGPNGKYIELSFISPVIGRKYMNDIKKISDYTGWDMSINPSVNQNEVINLASRLCSSVGINLDKYPSFNPVSLSVMVKVSGEVSEKISDVEDAFVKATGCSLLIRSTHLH